MKDTIIRKCDALIENEEVLHKGFMLENGLITTVAASSFADKGKSVDVEEFREARAILRKKEGALSEFRGRTELLVTAKMVASGNPEGFIDKVDEVYKKFQKGKFWGSTYRALTAMVICECGKYSEADAIIEKTNAILEGMKKEHRFLTSDEDTCIASLLAMTDKSVEDILAELEEAYQGIRKGFALHENAVYSLAQVMTTYGGSVEGKCEKVKELFEAFKAAGSKYGKGFELASLGTLVGVNVPAEQLAAEVIEVADYLKGKKGFGALDMGREIRQMFAAGIVVGDYAKNSAGFGAVGAADAEAGVAGECGVPGALSSAVVSSTVAQIIAEEVAALICIMCATAAANVAASSN